jgi:hypothetical protein
MALVDNAWYVNFGNGSSTGYYAIPTFPGLTVVAAGALYRQLTTPAVGSERVFVVTTGGVTTTEPTWTVTRGALNTSGTAVFQECTGLSGLNGDITNTPTWSINQTWTLGQHIYDPGTASIQICTVGGAGKTSGAPAFSATAGTTASDASATWTSCGMASSFAAWGAPHARLGNAFAANWGQAGNTFFVGDNHAEISSASITANCPGTLSSLCNVYCVDHTAAVPPSSANLMTTASILMANTYGNLFTFGGSGYFYGLTIGAAAGTNTNVLGYFGGTNNSYQKYENCVLQIPAYGNSIYVGTLNTNVTTEVELYNSTVSGGPVAVRGGLFRWKGGSLTNGGASSSFLSNGGYYQSAPSVADVQGVDLSSLTSGSTIFNPTAADMLAVIANCKLASGVTLSVSPLVLGQSCDFINCAATGVNYFQQRYSYQGSLTQSSAVYRSGGASDGTTPLSWDIATAAGSKWIAPFESFKIGEWNTLTGSTRTVTVYGLVNAAAIPNNDQIWLECEYFGSASSPLASFANNTKANNLAIGTALISDSTSNWGAGLTARQNSHSYSVGASFSVPDNSNRAFFVISGSGNTAASEPAGYASCVDGGTVTDGGYTVRAGCRFSMVVTLTAQLVGYIYGTVKAAEASTTFFVDPLMNFS